MPTQYDPRYLQGIAYFNDGLFFEAHDAWEAVWMQCEDESRKFYQGLIQAAVCLYHFGRRNTRGARKLFFSSHHYLASYQPWHLGIDVSRLLGEMERCLADVAASDDPIPTAELDRALVPRIHFCDTCES